MLYRFAIPPRTSPIFQASCAFILALFLLADIASPQSTTPSSPPSTAPPEAQPYTLHVYTDLVQIPTLVLAPDLRPLPVIPRERFNISLDSGPVFHPTQLEIEGDEPITLAILIDLSNNESYSTDALAAAIQPLAANSLLAHDRVSIFAVDCKMIRTALNKPVDDAAAITTAFQAAISSPRILGVDSHPHCPDSRRLWNDIGAAAETVADQPGRHVMIVISDGVDHRSPLAWETLRRYFIRHSIAMFGITPPLPRGGAPRARATFLEHPFDQLAEFSGGMVLYTTPNSLASNLQRVISLVRGRYILQFPRPSNGANGLHTITVTVSRSNDYVRTTGIAYPSRDPALQNAPDTIPSNPSPARFGDHNILTAPH